MKINLTDTNNAYKILQNYNGTNPYIISLKNSVYAYKDKTLNDFEIEYILKNYNTQPILISKTVKISKWYGEKKQMDWNTEFIPEKLFISYYFGETDTHYHCMIKYRQSVDFQPLFIPKKEILNPLFEENFLDKEIDFSKYNNKSGLILTKYQENAVKFLTTRKKGIVSLDMGMGKSMAAIVSALEGGYQKICVICPASLKTNWKVEIERFIPNGDITIVEGSKWKESRFTIINYDILKKFYTVPKETRKIKEKEFTDEGTVEWKIVEKEVKTNKKSIVDECLDNSQLYQANFDLLIVDEAHRLSNKSSGIYQIVEDLIKRTKIDSIFELTGTMVKNSALNLYNILKLIGAEVTKDWVNYMQKYCGAKQIFRNKKERDYYTNIFLKQHNKTEWKDLTYKEKDELNEYLSKTCKKIWIMGESTEENLQELSERIKHLYYREIQDFSKLPIKKETIVKKYDLTIEEKKIYDKAWDDYISNSEEKNIDKLIQNHKLIEGAVFRQILADFMIPRTIQLAESEINQGKKIIIFCSFDKELYALQEYFGERCVIYNGKMTSKKKDIELKKFKENETVKVFIGNIQAASVGLNLNESSCVLFNTFSFVPSDCQQCEYRCLRLGQDKDVKIYYQLFNDTYLIRMQEILNIKNKIINQIIKDE